MTNSHCALPDRLYKVDSLATCPAADTTGNGPGYKTVDACSRQVSGADSRHWQACRTPPLSTSFPRLGRLPAVARVEYVARGVARPGLPRAEGVGLVPNPDLLTLTQVAERLQVSRWTIYQLIWAGELASVHIGRCHRIRNKDVDAYIERLGPDAA
jgi:excisionase family DNA binding protein